MIHDLLKKPAHPEDAEKIIDRLTGRLSALPVARYLSSESFSAFCREHDMDDPWNGYREFSEDTMPYLYDSDVTAKAFVLLLRHIYHSRPADFPALFSHVLLGLSRMTPGDLPLGELKKDLLSLGYPEMDSDAGFSAVVANEEDKKRLSGECRKGT